MRSHLGLQEVELLGLAAQSRCRDQHALRSDLEGIALVPTDDRKCERRSIVGGITVRHGQLENTGTDWLVLLYNICRTC